MRNNELRPFGRLREHVRAPFDAITREELLPEMRELIGKLRQAEPVKSPLDDFKPPRGEAQ